MAEQVEQQQVYGRVVEEARGAVVAHGSLGGEAIRPVLERPEVGLEARTRQEDVCDDETKGEAQREENDEGGNQRGGSCRSRRRAPSRAGLSYARACQRKRPPGRGLRWSGVYPREKRGTPFPVGTREGPRAASWASPKIERPSRSGLCSGAWR